MRVDRVRQLFKSTTEQDGPFRPLYVESNEVKIYYELTQEELADAIVEWINNNHSSVEGRGAKVICTFNNGGKDGENKTVKPKFFEQYQITLEVEV